MPKQKRDEIDPPTTSTHPQKRVRHYYTRSLNPKFTYFPRLPQELRDMIWNFAITNTPGRLVEIKETETPQNQNRTQIAQYHSPTPVPSLLHTCRDSRALMLQRGWTIFGTQHRSLKSKNRRPAIPFNFSIDILHITPTFESYAKLKHCFLPSQMAKIQRIALPKAHGKHLHLDRHHMHLRSPVIIYLYRDGDHRCTNSPKVAPYSTLRDIALSWNKMCRDARMEIFMDIFSKETIIEDDLFDGAKWTVRDCDEKGFLFMMETD